VIFKLSGRLQLPMFLE